MTTSQLALVVAGLVGFGTPALGAWFERGREKARFVHERDLRDRDAMRVRLAEVAEALDALRRRSAVQVGLLLDNPGLSEIDDLPRFSIDADAALRNGELALAKLALWIRLDEGAGRAAWTCLHEQEALVTSINAHNSLRHYPDGFLDDLRQHRDAAHHASSRFIEQAREEFGPQ